MPKLADLIEIEQNLPIVNTRIKEKVECKKCGGTGLIIYTKLMEDGSRKLEYKYAARCNCANANGMSNNILRNKANNKEILACPSAKKLF